MRFDWDPEKSRQNLRKHGVSFEMAEFVFDDPFQVSKLDPCEHEVRWRTYGLVKGVVVLMVVHLIQETDDGEEEVRIISARKATSSEAEEYEKTSGRI
jgi:uncharacterized protein